MGMANSDNEELIIYEEACNARALNRAGIDPSYISHLSEDQKAIFLDSFKNKHWTDAEKFITESIARSTSK